MNLQVYAAPPPPAVGRGDHSTRRHNSVRTKRQKLIAAGKCVNYHACGNERGEDGTATMCRPCAAAKSSAHVPRQLRRRRVKAGRGTCIENRCDAPTHRNKRRCRQHLVMAAQAAKRHRERSKTGPAALDPAQ